MMLISGKVKGVFKLGGILYLISGVILFIWGLLDDKNKDENTIPIWGVILLFPVYIIVLPGIIFTLSAYAFFEDTVSKIKYRK